MILAGAGLLCLCFWAVTVGSADYSGIEILETLIRGGDDNLSFILLGVRIPRILSALAAGAALAIAGAIMQAVTRNPLADPGLLGVNAGASFCVVLAIAFLGVTAAGLLVWFAFAGALGAAVAVYALGSVGHKGATPVKLVLSGVIVASFLGSLTMAILVTDAQTFDVVRLWTAGSLKGRQMAEILHLLPYAICAILVSLLLAEQLNSLTLGTDIATGLGQNQMLWRGLMIVLVVALAGSAVAIAGPIGFVGLVVPHILRLSVGVDYRRILPLACLTGAGLTLLADTLPRAVFKTDVPVGISLAAIGAPVFIWLARRNNNDQT